MKTAQFFRYFALGLVFLFPLLSVVQLRDTDGPWRRVAKDIRPSVVSLQQAEGGSVVGCALIIQSSPLRVVTVGVLHTEKVVSYLHGERVEWSPVLVDTDQQFTILQADSDLQGETAGAASLLHANTASATVLDLAADGISPDGVKAALVGPPSLDSEALWVGLLRPGTTLSGQPQYLGSLMRRVSEIASIAMNDAWAADVEEISSDLHGAPFVDAEGKVIGLYLGREGHHVRVLPIELVSRSFVLLHLQAAQ